MANKLISELTNQASVANADEMEVQVSGELVTKKSTVEAVTEVERNARVAQDNVIEAGIGANADGTYNTPSGTNYLDSSTSVMNALEILDGQIGASNIVTEIVGVSSANLNNAGISPYEIIAAPGATAWIEVIACSIRLAFDTTQVECGSQKLVLEYDTGSSHFMEWANSFIESASTVINKATWTSEVAIPLNKKVQLTFDGAANPTAGNSTLKVAITYRIWDYNV